MIKKTLRESVRSLPVEDRIELMEEISHSIAADQRDIPLQRWQQEVLAERMAAYEANPARAISHTEFKAKVEHAVKKLRTSAKKPTK